MSSSTDRRGQLDDEVFTYQTTKDGQLRIAWQGKTVTVLKGPAAQRLLQKLTGLEQHGAQLVLAKATGNFKRGNEKRPSLH